MKNSFIYYVGFLLSLCMVFCAHASNEQEEFIARVNEAWVSSNNIALESVINSQLEDNPDDLLALGLRFIYQFIVIIDYDKARVAAQDYVTAVSNRMPSEVINRRIPINLAMHFLEMPVSTNLPAVRTPEEMKELHKYYKRAFPLISIYSRVPQRIENLEAGIITDEDLIPFNEASILESTNNFGLPPNPE